MASGPPTQVALTWSPAADAGSGIRGYRVYRAGAFYAWADGNQFTDTAVAPATTYSYTVFAQDGADNLGAASNKVTVTTPVTHPRRAAATPCSSESRSTGPGECATARPRASR